MTEAELKSYLTLHFPMENERCEWKEYKNLTHAVSGHTGEDIISYVSAIANMNGGHLIIGIRDLTLDIIGIQNFHTYNSQNIKLKLLQDCINLSSEGLRIEEITTTETNKTIWIIHIPRHPFRQVVYAHKRAWQRIGDSLTELKDHRRNTIIHEVRALDDWSAVALPDATIDELDEKAILKAKEVFVIRNPKYKNEIHTWDTSKFLNKAKLTIKGKITRTCMILLGKEEEEYYLDSSVKIRWNLRTVDNLDKDYAIFSIPFILSVEKVLHKIRNLTYRYLQEGSLFPEEVLRYDPFSIREPLHNAIAHQDYSEKARINVVEYEDDHLVFTNYGSFLPGSVEEVVLSDAPEEKYRNPFLVEAMKSLDMIETQGGGIRKMFLNQKERYFPMPDYDFSDGKVKVTITGKVLDIRFAKLLINNPYLLLEDILLLDKVQKKQILSREAYKYLRSKGFIEGRKPNYFLSSTVVNPVDDDSLKAQYIANRSFNDEYFMNMIFDYIDKFDSATRAAIDTLIIPKLSDVLDDKQKKAKVGNLLTKLRKQGLIKTSGYGTWIKDE